MDIQFITQKLLKCHDLIHNLLLRYYLFIIFTTNTQAIDDEQYKGGFCKNSRIDIWIISQKPHQESNQNSRSVVPGNHDKHDIIHNLLLCNYFFIVFSTNAEQAGDEILMRRRTLLKFYLLLSHEFLYHVLDLCACLKTAVVAGERQVNRN